MYNCFLVIFVIFGDIAVLNHYLVSNRVGTGYLKKKKIFQLYLR